MLRKVLMLSTTITTTMVDKKEEDAEYDSDDHGAAGWCGEERRGCKWEHTSNFQFQLVLFHSKLLVVLMVVTMTMTKLLSLLALVVLVLTLKP
jgi:hypothetical protein